MGDIGVVCRSSVQGEITSNCYGLVRAGSWAFSLLFSKCIFLPVILWLELNYINMDVHYVIGSDLPII